MANLKNDVFTYFIVGYPSGYQQAIDTLSFFLMGINIKKHHFKTGIMLFTNS